MRIFARLLTLCLGFSQAVIAAQTLLFPNANPDPAQAIEGAALLGALRQGGYTLYFRHTATDMSQTDSGMQSATDCANQRALSAQGRSEAKRIGETIRQLGIPIGEVLASPYCRTFDSATLLFRDATRRAEIRGQNGDYAALGKLLLESVKAGSNRAVVGHGNGMRALAGAPHLDEGEAVVIGWVGGKAVIRARIKPEQWQSLLSVAAPR